MYLNGEILNDIVIPESTININNFAFSVCNSITTTTLND